MTKPGFKEAKPMSATPNEIQRYAETLAPEARRLAIRTGISKPKSKSG